MLPVLFLTAGFVVMRRLFADVSAGQTPNVPLFIAAFFNNLFHAVTLLLLIWQLAGRSGCGRSGNRRRWPQSR